MSKRDLPAFMTGETRAITLEDFASLPSFMRPAPKFANWTQLARTGGIVAQGGNIAGAALGALDIPGNIVNDVQGHRRGVDPNAIGAGAADYAHAVTTPARGMLSALSNVGQFVPGPGQIVSPIASGLNASVHQAPYYSQQAVQTLSKLFQQAGIPDVIGAADQYYTKVNRTIADAFRKSGNSQNSLVSGIGDFGHAMMGSYVAPNAVSQRGGVVGAANSAPQLSAGSMVPAVSAVSAASQAVKPPQPPKPPQPIQPVQPPQPPKPAQPLRSMSPANNFNSSPFSSYIGTKPQSLTFPQTKSMGTRSMGATPRSSYFR